MASPSMAQSPMAESIGAESMEHGPAGSTASTAADMAEAVEEPAEAAPSKGSGRTLTFMVFLIWPL